MPKLGYNITRSAIKMKKSTVVLLIIGIILLIIPFCLSEYSLARIIILALGIFLITLSFVFLKRKNIFLIIILPIILICLSYAVDTFLFYQLSRIPIFVYEIKSSDNISTYNSFFYRIFNCNGDLILDYGYHKNYVCNNNDLNTIDVNTFLSDINNTIKSYHNKFVKISGKISKISGSEVIELSSYTTSTNSLNGYVNFNNDYIIKVHVNESLSNYRIYDNITVIGRVTTKKEENDQIVINLIDTVLIPSDIYQTFTYEIINDNANKLVSLVSEQNYYLYGIKSLNIKYANSAIYELSYLITDSRITLDDIIGQTSAYNIYNADNVLVAKSYELEKFNVLVCENTKKILANKNLALNSNLCEQ